MDCTPLGKLPPELRLEIFEYVFDSEYEDRIVEWDDKGPKLPPWMTTNHRQALTMVCRQIRVETFPRFYQCNKISLRSISLDKFEPSFFITEDERHLQMIQDYLGSPSRWQEELCGFLSHVGPEVFNNITAVDIHIGTWDKSWADQNSNPVMFWLAEALANVVRLLQSSGIEVNLCLFIKTKHWARGGTYGELSCPISDIHASYSALSDFIDRQKRDVAQSRHSWMQEELDKVWDESHEMLRSFLGGLDRKIRPDDHRLVANK